MQLLYVRDENQSRSFCVQVSLYVRHFSLCLFTGNLYDVAEVSTAKLNVSPTVK